jgi:hypothetical protein
VQALKTNLRLAQLFESDAGLLEGYTIEEHTLFVLHQFERYFSQEALPDMNIATFRLLLALHDIGKPLADATHNQRERTIEILDSLASSLPLSSRDVAALKLIIGHDHFGSVLKKALATSATREERLEMHAREEAAILDRAALVTFRELCTFHPVDELKAQPWFQEMASDTTRWFMESARVLNTSPERLFDVALTYFQCDTLAYTSDAVMPNGRRAKVGLDYLYDLNWPQGLVRPEKMFVKSGHDYHVRFEGTGTCYELISALRRGVSEAQGSQHEGGAPLVGLSPEDLNKVECICLPHWLPKDQLSARRFYAFLGRAARIGAMKGRIHFLITVDPETPAVVASYLDAIGTRHGDFHVIDNWRQHKELRVKLEKQDKEKIKRCQDFLRQPLPPDLAAALLEVAQHHVSTGNRGK